MLVQCISCGAENRQDARFCRTCGKPLVLEGAIICMSCHRANKPGSQRCSYCSTPFAAIGTAAPPMPQPPAVSAAMRSMGQLAPNVYLHNRYTVTRLLGIGGMSAVYEGYDARLGNQRVAIKEMSLADAEPARQQQLATQFKQEAGILARLSHGNLPHVTDYFAETAKHYLVMDFVNGQSLQKVLEAKAGPLPEAVVVSWMLQLCDVLQYLHSCQPPVIFRDLKPSNIMVQPDGRIKLIDFGIARIYKPGKTHDTSTLGTSGFAPPEQYGKGQTDARSDVYSLCITAYNLLTNYEPGKSPFNLPPLSQLNPSVSPRLVRILATGMALDAKKRWQCMAELRQELASTGAQPTSASAVPVRPAQPAARPVVPPTTRLLMAVAQLSPRQLLALLSAGLLLVVVFLVLIVPVMVRTELWGAVDGIALIAPLAYAMARRRSAAFISQVSVAVVGGLAVNWILHYPNFSLIPLLAAAVASGVFVELWLLPLPMWVVRNPTGKWWLELLWLAAMAALATPLLRAIVYGPNSVLNPVFWFSSALLGCVGWFVGDLVRQYVIRRRITRG
jgi:serine/threonine-protein kinase